MLQILGKNSSINVRKVLWLCEELGLSHEREDWGVGFASTQTPEFLKLNPNGLVPVIRDQNFVLWESNAIIRYLARAYGPETLYPSDAQASAVIDQWIDWQGTELNPSWSYAFMAMVRRSPLHTDPGLIESSLRSWTKNMRILDAQLLSTKEFVQGKFSLADIPIGLSVHRWFSTPLKHPPLLGVQEYYERLTERRAYQMYGRNGLP